MLLNTYLNVCLTIPRWFWAPHESTCVDKCLPSSVIYIFRTLPPSSICLICRYESLRLIGTILLSSRPIASQVTSPSFWLVQTLPPHVCPPPPSPPLSYPSSSLLFWSLFSSLHYTRQVFVVLLMLHPLFFILTKSINAKNLFKTSCSAISSVLFVAQRFHSI